MRSSFYRLNAPLCALMLFAALLAPVSSQGSEDALESLETYNLTPPPAPKGWRETPAKLLNPDACYLIRSRDSQAYLMVLAEIAGVESQITTEMLGDIVRENFESNATTGDFVLGEKTTAVGMEGQSAKAIATVNRTKLVYEYWYGINNGLALQVIGWSTPKKRRELSRVHRDFIENLTLIDPDLRYTNREWIPSTLDFKEDGFRAALGKAQWWVSSEDNFPSAALHAEHPLGGYLQVVHLQLSVPGITAKTALQGYLSSIGINLDAQTILLNKGFKTDRADEARRLQMKLDTNGTLFLDNYEIYRRGDHFYILNAWIDQSLLHSEWQPEEAFSKISFDANPPSLNFDAIPPERRDGLANFTNHIGLTELNRGNKAKALSLFQRAYEIDPTKVVFASNIAYTLLELKRAEEAKHSIEKALERHPDDESLMRYMAEVEVQLELFDQAIERYEGLFTKGISDSDIVLDYINLLLQQGRFEEAIELTSTYSAENPSRQPLRWHAQVYTEAKQYDNAIEVYVAIAEEEGWDSQLYSDVITTHYYAGQNELALEWIDRLEEEVGIDSNSHLMRGKSQLELGWYKDARRSFEAALEERSQDSEAREYLDYVNSLLGKGDATGTSEPLTAVPIPEELATKLKDLEEASIDTFTKQGLDSVTTRNIECYAYDARKLFRRTHYLSINILTKEGAKSFGNLNFSFDPTFEKIYIHSIEVIDSNGEVLSQADPDDFYVLDENEEGTADDDQVLYAPVPGVRPGVTLKYVYSVERRSRPDFFPFTEEFFFSSSQMTHKVISVTHPEGSLSWKAGNGLQDPVIAQPELTVWIEENPNRILSEPYTPSRREIGPWLAMGSRETRWETLIDDYLEEIADRLEPVPETKVVLDEILSPEDTEDSKLRRIIAYVRDTLTYQAIEFGHRGTIPEKCDVILSNHYGDCKDHALLAYHLMREAGFQPKLILCHTSKDAIEELPSLDQFNHMIVALPTAGGWRFFDTTDKYVSTTISPPVGLAEHLVAPLDTTNFSIIQIPGHEEDSQQIKIDRTIKKSGDGTIFEITEETHFTGHYAAFIRSWLSRRSKAEYTTAFSQLFSDYGQYTFIEATAKNLNELDEPLALSLRYTSPSVSSTGELEVVDIPLPWQGYYLSFSGSNTRNFPLRINYPLSLNSTVRLMLETPQKVQKDDPIFSSSSEKNAWLKWTRNTKEIESGIEINFSSKISHGIYDTDQYDRLLSSFRNAEKAASPTIIISKKAP